jgi:limonene-1,2-epoxide hydrolase
MHEHSSAIEWPIQNIGESEEGVVFTERLDRFQMNGKWLEIPVMGVFELENGKITGWRDYFDLQTITSQLS